MYGVQCTVNSALCNVKGKLLRCTKVQCNNNIHIQYIVHCTMYNVQCTLYNEYTNRIGLQCLLALHMHIIHCTVYTHYTLNSVYSVYYIVYNVYMNAHIHHILISPYMVYIL